MKRNVAEEVSKRISELKEGKAAELLTLKTKIDVAEQALNKAEAEMRKATENTDLKAYTEAKHKADEGAAAVEMYTARYKQLETKSFVSEEESDLVFDSLETYEKELTEEYQKNMQPILQKLAEINKSYKNDISTAEQTIKAWESEIHANYRSKYTTYVDGSHRSDRPVPMRPRPYLGCDLSERVYHFLAAEKLS